jgi:hypothetical protein
MKKQFLSRCLDSGVMLALIEKASDKGPSPPPPHPDILIIDIWPFNLSNH